MIAIWSERAGVRAPPDGKRRILLPAGALCAALLLGPAGASEDSAIDRGLVRSEISLEHSLECAAESMGSMLPIPEPPAPAPAIDGRLDDPFWRAATSFVWEVLGDSEFRMPFSWRLRAARGKGSLYLAGEREGPLGPREILSLDASWKERLVIRIAPEAEGGSSAGIEREGSTADAARHGAEFAASASGGAARWELRVPLENDFWTPPLGALRPLRLTASRGRPGEIFVSPPFHLIPAPLILRVGERRAGLDRRIEVGAELENLSGRAQRMWLPELSTAELPAGGRMPLRFEGGAFPGPGGLGWSFSAGPWNCRLGAGTDFADLDGVSERIAALLDAAAANLSRARAPAAGLEARVAGARRRLDGLRGGPIEELERFYLDVRLLRRSSFLAGLGDSIGEVLLVKRHHYRSGPFYTTYLHDMPGGGLAVWSPVKGSLRDLIELPAGASVRDPALHPDGRRIVFSLRNGPSTHLYEVRSDGTGLRSITSGNFHDLEPAWVPEGRIVFGSTRAGSRSPVNATENYCLHIVREDGTALMRLSYNYLVDFTPSVLPDGRILFLRWAHDDKPGNFINALWTIQPDGRGLAGYFGLNRSGVSIEPQPIPGTGRVVCLDTGPNGHWRSPQVGDIGVIDADVDRDNFIYRIEAGAGGFKNPYPVGPDAFLVSWGRVETRWAIYLVDRWGNRELIYRDPEISCFNPVPLRPRPEPHRLVNLRAADGNAPAEVFIQDIYQGLPEAGRGEVRSLRVVAVPDKPPREIWGLLDQTSPVSALNRMVRRELGVVPVHPDGSARFEVPSNQSLFFQALDADGFAVQTMRDTIQFAPGEKRACIGCHEPRRQAPPPGFTALAEALRRPPARLEAPAAPSISFPRDVQPILDRRCLPCHDAANPAGGVILSGDPTPYFNLAYETLTRGGYNANNQNWGDRPVDASGALAPAAHYITASLPAGAPGARASPLVRLIDRGHHGVALEAAERRELARWIDLNIPYYDDWETGRLGKERRLLSGESEAAVAAVLRLRCRGCHAPPDLFRGAAVSLSRPELSPILRAPMARARGGTGLCRLPVFDGPGDPDYRTVLRFLEKDRDRYQEGRKP